MPQNKFLSDLSILVDNETMRVFGEFYELTQIPRKSEHEQQVLNYIINKAESLNLKYKQDGAGNLVVYKPSRNKDADTIAIQSHVDMVCESTNASFNPLTDPIMPYVDDSWIWVKAKETSLGADNGIGAAYMLTLMEEGFDSNIEFLFTVNEENGLKGVQKLNLSLNATKLINLDSEEPDAIFVGSASSVRYKATLNEICQFNNGFSLEDIHGTSLKGYFLEFERKHGINLFQYGSFDSLSVLIDNFPGGHSGLQIKDTLRGNPIKIAAYLLNKLLKFDSTLLVSNFNGGSKDNAIPRDCSFVLTKHDMDYISLGDLLSEEIKSIMDNYEGRVITEKMPNNTDSSFIMGIGCFTSALNLVHSGVLYTGTSKYCDVDTSNNLGVVKTTKDGVIAEGMLRSSNDYRQNMELSSIRDAFESNLFKFEVVNAYPGWEPKDSYPLLDIAKEHAQRYLGKVEVKAVHAGLECGIICGKNPGMEAISIGPLIEFPHSPNERVCIKSVQRYNSFIRSLIKGL